MAMPQIFKNANTHVLQEEPLLQSLRKPPPPIHALDKVCVGGGGVRVGGARGGCTWGGARGGCAWGSRVGGARGGCAVGSARAGYAVGGARGVSLGWLCWLAAPPGLVLPPSPT